MNLFEEEINKKKKLGQANIHYKNAASILTPASGFMESYDYTLNPYSGCSFGCTYCYAAFFARANELKENWGYWVNVKENALDLLKKFRKKDLKNKTIYISSVTDPYQPIEKELELTRNLLEELLKYHQPKIVIQTRSPLVMRDIDLLKQFEFAQVNMTITTDSEKVRKVFEPYCPSNKVRLEAIQKIHEADIKTCITLTPLLPVEDADEFAQNLLNTGIQNFIIQPFHAEKGKFAAGTREEALKIIQEMNWNDTKYQQTLQTFKKYIPSIGEGKEGFSAKKLEDMNEKLLKWLNQQQSTLDRLIFKSASDFYSTYKDKRYLIDDINNSSEELWQLSKGKDVCYDRPTIGFVYSLWYHAKRVNTFLRYFANTIVNTSEKEIELFDLGAGTGAVKWAVALVYAGMKELGLTPPSLKIINIDTSPSMLDYNKSFLWKKFVEQYPICTEIQTEYDVNSWNNTDNKSYKNTWIAASYLFDHSDNKEVLGENFNSLVEKYKPNILLLTTAFNKKALLEEIIKKVAQSDKKKIYLVNQQQENIQFFTGNLPEINRFRKGMNDKFRTSFRGNANWDDNALIGAVLQRQNQGLDFGSPIDKIDLFNPKITIRREIKLNELQIKAAKNNEDRAAIITGPAGCGKSIVITERIKNLLETHHYSPKLNILLTTFNKDLIHELFEWLKNILDITKTTHNHTDRFTFNGSNKPNITLHHFDILSTRLADIHKLGSLKEDDAQLKIIKEIINQIKIKNNIIDASKDDILNSDFILEEYERVYYGLQYHNKELYLNEERTGRGQKPKLDKNSEKRKLAWECLFHYNQYLDENKIQSYRKRRDVFYQMLKNSEIEEKYTHIFVDEFQDCTGADFDIFYYLLENPNHLVIAGDLAQSLHLGRSAKIPKTESMLRRSPTHYLEGSYRLPYRVSECIAKLSQNIVTKYGKEEGVNMISPQKSAPPGARPIVVYGRDSEEMSKKIAEIVEAYDVYDLNKQTIVLEKDYELSRPLNKLGIRTESETILKIKGLEKKCVIWSTRAGYEDNDEFLETVYTILTRTSSILIIALFENTLQNYKKVIYLLNKERLILWDNDTKLRYEDFCEEFEQDEGRDE